MLFLQNTPKHYKYAIDLWKQLDESRELRRSLYFLSALALKQNNPKTAINLLSQTDPKYVTSRFIHLAAYTNNREFKNAFNILRQTINMSSNDSLPKKATTGKELVTIILFLFHPILLLICFLYRFRLMV